MSDAKILVIDIETAPLELRGWGLWDQNFSLDQIAKDWSILSYAAKWIGKPKIYYGDTGGRGKKQVRNDRKLMKPIRDLLNEADIVVAQNGKKFDMRKVNARLIQHGLRPPKPYRVIDTLLEARKYFAFTSQKLKHTSEILGVPPKDEHEEFPGFKLWIACLDDIAAAWRVMKRYNKQDVLSTEHVYLKIRPWIANHPNLGVYQPLLEKPICPNCGSTKLKPWDRRANLQQGAYIRLLCQACGAWSRGKEMLLKLSKRRSMLAPG
jgi:RNase_H superfamily